MHNLKLTLAYDGSEFSGWQIQPGQPTVQGSVTDILSQITQEQPTLQGAGRTDAGVHAWGQVATFKTSSEIPPRELGRALNALLPESIRVREVEEVSRDFHARWFARAKTYRYRLLCGPIVPPPLRNYILHHPAALDVAAMAEGARLFEGQHDFTSFAASTGDVEEDQQRLMQRVIFRSELLPASAAVGNDIFPDVGAPHPQEWIYIVRGQSFLRHMVRKIVGTLLEIGRGRLAPADVPRILALRDRAGSGPTAAAQGLCLLAVEYPDPTNSLEDRQGNGPAR